MNTEMSTDQPVYTVNELMARWKMSRRTVLEVIHAGKLRAFKVGRRVWRIAREEVERYERAGA